MEARLSTPQETLGTPGGLWLPVEVYSVELAIAFALLPIATLISLRFERGAPGASITTGATAFWWAFVTMTNVGYGDYVPVTDLGRLLAIGLMTFGIGIFAVLTSFLASKFVLTADEVADALALLIEQNAAIRAELADFKEKVSQQGKDEE